MAYCVRADVEVIYGKDNVNKWGDINNTGELDEVTSRVSWAIDNADVYIDGKLKGGPYKLPFTSTPALIKDLSARLAGHFLFQTRILDDEVPSEVSIAEQHKRYVDQVLREIVSGVMKLLDSGVTIAVEIPEAVPVAETETTTTTTGD